MKKIKVLLFLIILSLFYPSCHKEYAEPQTLPQIPEKSVTAPPPAYGNKIVSLDPYESSKKTYTIYIDSTFTSIQETMIWSAISSWENVSSQKIQFEPYFKMDRPGKIQQFLYKKHKENFIYIWNIKSEDLDKDLVIRFNLFAGFWDTSGNILIFDERIGDRFHSIILHELGHALGLAHYNENYLTVMRYMYATNCITEIDAQLLCKIHNCSPVAECETKYYLTSNSP